MFACLTPFSGVEWGEAVLPQSEAGDPLEPPVEMRGVDDLRLAFAGPDRRHPSERGGVSGSYLAFDDKPVARRDIRRLNMADEVAVWVWG